MDINQNVRFDGQYYEDVVPDTYDLAERAEWALKAAIACLDKNLHYWMHFSVYYGVQTPAMRHTFPDVDCAPKLLEAITMLCHMTGDKEHQYDYHEYMKNVLDYIEDDYLFWGCRAEKDRPWGSVYWMNPPDHALENVKYTEDIARIGMTSKAVQVCLTLFQVSGDDYWMQQAKNIQKAVDNVTILKDDYAYVPMYSGNHMPAGMFRTGWSNTDEAQAAAAPNEGTCMDTLGFFLRSLVMMYQSTGDEMYKDMAHRWAKYIMQPKFWGKSPVIVEKALFTTDYQDYYGDPTLSTEEPICIAGDEQGHWYLHNHCTMRGLRAILDYGIAMNDQKAIEFARRALDFSWSMGIPKLGWIPENPGRNNYMEACSIGDLIAYTIRLTDAGAGDYWDQTDAIIRNALAEAQYMRPEDMTEICNNAPRAEAPGSKLFGRSHDGKDIIEKTVGLFLSLVNPDGAEMSESQLQIMFCCMINCMTGLYYAWEAAVREEGDTAHVNLLFNRAAKGLDVYSYLPYEGRVVIQNKDKKQILVRIPGWTDKKSVRLTVDGVETAYTMAGLFMIIPGLTGQERIEIRFDVPEYSASYTVNARTPVEKKYTIQFRGANAVNVTPHSESPTYYHFYTDENLRTAKEVKTKKVTRFVPDRELKIW